MAGRQILTTSRLRLRELTAADLPFVADILAHTEVMAHYPGWLVAEGPQAWLDRQLRRYADDGYGPWLALRLEDDVPVGQIGLARQDVNGSWETEVGYLLQRPFWGHGYATEGAAACIRYGLETLGRPRVVALIREKNRPSQAVALRLGMEQAGTALHAGLEHRVYATSMAPELGGH